MLAATACKFWVRSPISIVSPVKINVITRGNLKSVRQWSFQPKRCYSDNSRFTRRRPAFGQALREREALSPFDVGKAALAGASLVGVGALCYYGLGAGSQPGAIDQAVVWPEYVRQRIKDTYTYFGGSLMITATSAVMAFRSPVIMNFVARNSFLAVAACIAAMIGTGEVCRQIPYQPGFGTKQLAWMLHSSVVGIVLAPVCIIGGPILVRAAWYTAGVVGGLSAIACCAPSDKFLYMGGPLAMGLGVVFASSLGSMFLSPTSMLGASAAAISIYGGLILFSGFLLYDTQRIVRAAEVYPQYHPQPYDPVNMSISIFLDTINIFIRIATILSGSQQRK
ncbi:growth hormone-inducible transmembrane protein [Rhodnius prolixus]